MKARMMTILATVTAIIVVAVGCGGGDDSTSSAGGTSSAPDKATFTKEAGAACQQARKDAFDRIAAYEKEHRSEGLSKAVLIQNAFKAVLLSTIQTEVAALRELEAPAGDKKEIEAILSELQKSVDAGKKAKKKRVEQVEELFTDADKKLQAYGLAECTKNG